METCMCGAVRGRRVGTEPWPHGRGGGTAAAHSLRGAPVTVGPPPRAPTPQPSPRAAWREWSESGRGGRAAGTAGAAVSVSCPCVLTLLSVCLCSVRLPGRLLRGCVLTQGDASPRVGALARSILQPMVSLLGDDSGGGTCGGECCRHCHQQDKDSGRLGGGHSPKGPGDPLSKVERFSLDEGC